MTIYLVNGILYLRRQSITYDEPGHLNYGVRVLKGSTSRDGDPAILNSKMPVSALNALPRAVEQLRHPGLVKHDNGEDDILHGRYITLFVSLLTALFVFRWSRELYGDAAAVFSLFLFVFCPNCLAQAGLVTTDAYAVLLLLLVLYYLWRYCTAGRDSDFLLFCLFTGIAQLVKQSLFHLYVILPCLLLIHHFTTDPAHRRPLLQRAVIFLLINLLVINTGFLFQGSGTPLKDYHFISGLFQGLQHTFSFLGGCPLPLPYSFVQGLDMAKYYEQLGGGFPNSSFGNITILGHSSTGGSFWYYYFVICAFKTPLAILCLLLWSMWYLLRRNTLRRIVRNEGFLLFPVLYIFLLFDFFYKSQTSIRHIIFIYPLLYIFCGTLFRYIHTRRERIAVALLSLAYVASVLFYFRNYIPYTNELIIDKKMAYRTVGAANLNFGQGGQFLEEYLRIHPDVTMASSTPRPGRQAIAIDDLLDIWNTHRFDWMRSFTPAGHIAHYYLIFDIAPDQIKQYYADPSSER